jgi:hypothetical protein
MLCDGRMVCGCADPYGHRVLGDVRAAPVHPVNAIWTGTTIRTLREELNAGGSKFCGDCPLKLPLKKDDLPVTRPLDAGQLPSRLYIECTAACNISCAEACCAPETGITRTRQAGMLDFDLFRRVVDEAGPSLVRIDFFNYGEAFLHKRAIEMCEYIKTHFPQVYLYTSTNGLAFSEAQARRLAHSGIDEVTFSIDGARIDIRTLVPGLPALPDLLDLPLRAHAGRPTEIHTRVENLSTRAFPAQASYGRRLVRLGAQLCDASGAVIDRDFARAWLPQPLEPGARADVAITIPAPAQPGCYRLKFDLVSEGIDWFERCGSETTTKTLLVR